MPRDGSGVYTLPSGNPVVTLTTIASAWANTTMADIAAQLNNVFTRDGLLGPTGPFKLMDGTVNAPGLAWNSEPGLGWYREAAGIVSMAKGGGKRFAFHTAGAADSYLVVLPGQAAGTSSLQMWSDPEPHSNSDFLTIRKESTSSVIAGTATGTGTVKPLTISGFPSATFVNMPVQISQVGPGNATLVLNHLTQANASDIYGQYNGVTQWLLRLGAGGAPNSFSIDRYSDAGAALGAAFSIDRLTGNVSLQTNLTAGVAIYSPTFTTLGSANSAWYQDAGQVVFQFAANNYFTLNKSDGNITLYRGAGLWTRFEPGAGDMVNYGSIFPGGDKSFGVIANGAFPYIRWSADNWRLQFNRSNGDLSYINQANSPLLTVDAAGTGTFAGNVTTNSNSGAAGAINLNNNGWIRFHQPSVGIKYLRTSNNNFQVLNQAATVAILDCTDGGRLFMNNGYACKNGTDGGFGANAYNWMWNGANMYCFVDNANQGWVSFNSDERIKRDIAPLESSEDGFMKLVPISYYKRNDEVMTDTSLHHGLSAQNVRASLGEPTTLGNFEDDPNEPGSFPAGVDDRAVIAHVILRVQDLINRVKQLETQ